MSTVTLIFSGQNVMIDWWFNLEKNYSKEPKEPKSELISSVTLLVINRAVKESEGLIPLCLLFEKVLLNVKKWKLFKTYIIPCIKYSKFMRG